MTALQNKVQENQKTIFVTRLAPDKLTAYADFLKTDEYRNTSWYHTVAATNIFDLPPLNAALKFSINNQIVDVYLPNDTHWSSTGHRIVAESLYQYLVKRGILVPTGEDYQSQSLP